MQQIRSAILKHVRINNKFVGNGRLLLGSAQYMCSSSISAESDHILSRVIDLVKRYDKIDANKVTETADFQKDLSLDSLDRVELVMAIEQEFSIEIPDEKADKFSCCGDVVKYLKTESN